MFTRTFTRALLQTAAASALTVSAFCTVAHAGVDISIAGDGFSGTPIRVISEDGKTWTKIEERVLSLPLKVGAGKTDHTIHSYAARQTAQKYGDYLFHNSYNATNTRVRIDFAGAYNGSTNHLSAEERQNILAECNSNLNKGSGIHETHNEFVGVGVELAVNFVPETWEMHYDDWATAHMVRHKASGTATVPVTCVRARTPSNDLVAATPDFKVKGVNLRFMTTAGYPTAPNPGTRCQLTHAKVRVETTKPGPVKFKLWTKVGNGPTESQFVEAWSSFVGPGKHEASFLKALPVSKTTEVQAMVEEMNNPIGLSTGWKSVTVDCTGAGGGGLATAPGTANPDGTAKFPAPPRRVFGDQTHGLTTGKPEPTHSAPSAPNQVKTAPLPGARGAWRPATATVATSSSGAPVAVKDRFYPRKPHVN